MKVYHFSNITESPDYNPDYRGVNLYCNTNNGNIGIMMMSYQPVPYFLVGIINLTSIEFDSGLHTDQATYRFLIGEEDMSHRLQYIGVDKATEVLRVKVLFNQRLSIGDIILIGEYIQNPRLGYVTA